MEEPQQLSEAKDKLVRCLGIPVRILNIVSDDRVRVAETPAVLGVSQHDDKTIIVLTGAPGCGKSVSAALWLASYVFRTDRWQQTKDGWRFAQTLPVWTRASELARIDHYDADVVNPLLLSSRLVIDDCGEEYLDKFGFYTSLLDEIVSTRHEQLRPTLMTTRLSSGCFFERYGERMISRLRADGVMFGCGDIDQRGGPPGGLWTFLKG